MLQNSSSWVIVCLLLSPSDSLELELLAGGSALNCQAISAARYRFLIMIFFKKSDEVLSV